MDPDVSKTGDIFTREYAISLDKKDPLSYSKELFRIPTEDDLKVDTIESLSLTEKKRSSPNCVYLCGNSLGLQPRITATRLQQYLTTWATQGVQGHFKPLKDSPLPTWVDIDARASESMAPILGALPSEVAVMSSLTGNLHLLLSAFYKPSLHGRHKIIIEKQAFPSDHFVAESQIRHHGLDPSSSLVTISPKDRSQTLSTAQIISAIEEHGSSTAIILFPGIQYYTGQLFDIPVINAAAKKAGIFCIWDLAHAVGNVELKLHDWNVDAAVWCNYKYLNSGPGAAGGFYIHGNHSQVSDDHGKIRFIDRLSGWWGSDKKSRFAMDNSFRPIPGAAGFQLSNPSISDLTSVTASLEIFSQVCQWQDHNQAKDIGIAPLREKSKRLTSYLEAGLQSTKVFADGMFHIITPSQPDARGAQLSLKLEPGLIDIVMEGLQTRGILVDERRPDVIRVAPAPLYNTFEDCCIFIEIFSETLNIAVQAKNGKIDVQET